MGKKNKKKTVKRIPENENENEMGLTRRYKIKINNKKQKHSKAKKIIKISILVALFVIIIVAGICIGKVYGIFKEAKINMEEVVIKYENSVVKDIDGNTIAVLSGDENRETISISEMSPYIPKAFVAIEDERFYEHDGVDLKRTAAATITYILNGGNSSFGGSTITQQLVKNLTKEDERAWQRKVKEMARAYYIEEELSKSQILELYLNLIFLGGQTYGVEIASNYYFSKSATDLTLAESAFLAGINNSPNLYSAFSTEEKDINKIKKRVKIVIDKMLELGQEDPNHKAAITQEEYDTAIAELEAGLAFNKGKITQIVHSYHTDAAINQVKKELQEIHKDWTTEYVDYYVKSGGLTIYTTQNTGIQQIMEEEVKDDKYIEYSKFQVDEDGNAKIAQTAMVLIDHKTGYVLATVGGIGEKTTAYGLNRATQSARQPGSSMKPLAVLCPGIDNGIITAASVYDDIPYYSGTYEGYKNYGHSYTGLTTLRHNTAQSKNIPMLKAINDIGVETSVAFLESAGISIKENQKNMTIALGSAEASPLQMAGAYAAIANDGVYIEPTFYTKVVDSEGNTVLEKEQETRTIMSSATAYIVKEVLTEVVRSGAGWYARISGISVGVKTGTSQDDVDRWFCGFTPYYTAATWYGYDDNRETVRASSYNPAGYIWDGVMEQIHTGLEGKTFADTRPSNVTSANICKASGKIATEICNADPRGNQVYREYFVKGTVPTETCDCHVQVTICKGTGLIANEFCTDVETKVFITRPETETGDWSKAADAAYMLIVKDTCTTHVAPPVEEKPEPPQQPEIPEEPEIPEKPQEPENNTTGGNTTGENTSGGNTTGGNTTGGNTSGENTTGGNTSTGNNSSGGTTGGNTSGDGTQSGNTSSNDNTTTGGVVIEDIEN